LQKRPISLRSLLIVATPYLKDLERCTLRYRVANTHRIPYLYTSFSAKEPYEQWLFCEKRPADSGIPCIFDTLCFRHQVAMYVYVCVCVCVSAARWTFSKDVLLLDLQYTMTVKLTFENSYQCESEFVRLSTSGTKKEKIDDC